MPLSLPAVLAFIVAGSAITVAGDTPAPQFVRGILYRHYLISCASQTGGVVRVHATDLKDDEITHTTKVAGQSYFPAIVTVYKGRLFLNYHEIFPANITPHVEEVIKHVSVDAFCAGRWEPVDADGRPQEMFHRGAFWMESNQDQFARIRRIAGPGARIERDLVAVGDQAVLRFELVIPWPKAEQEPSGRMRVIRIERPYDKSLRQWQPVTANVVEEFEIAFAEPFQAVVVGKEYYFVTHSGNLFHASPPELGKPRRTMLYWGPAQGRLTALITDANKGQPFVFGRDDKGWFYANLADNIDRKRFDRKIPMDKAFPYETALELTRVLLEKEEIILPGQK